MPLQPNKQIQTSRAYPSIDDTHYIPWLDVRLTGATMDHLWNIISDCRDDARSQLAGNISKSAWLLDKDNYFYDNVLKKMSEYMFYEDWNNYCIHNNIKVSFQKNNTIHNGIFKNITKDGACIIEVNDINRNYSGEVIKNLQILM